MGYTIKVGGELYHHRIKGQRWGVRRYQNYDGSYTSAGRARKGYSNVEKGVSLKDTSSMNKKELKKYTKTLQKDISSQEKSIAKRQSSMFMAERDYTSLMNHYYDKPKQKYKDLANSYKNRYKELHDSVEDDKMRLTKVKDLIRKNSDFKVGYKKGHAVVWSDRDEYHSSIWEQRSDFSADTRFNKMILKTKYSEIKNRYKDPNPSKLTNGNDNFQTTITRHIYY